MGNVGELQTLVLWTSAFFLVLSVWLGAVLLWLQRKGRQQDRLTARLHSENTSSQPVRSLRLWNDQGSVRLSVEEARSSPLLQRLKSIPEQAGWSTPMSHLLTAVGLGSIFLASMTYLLVGRGAMLASVMSVFLVPLAVYLYFRRCVELQRALIENQIIDGLALCGRALRAGHPLVGAFELVAMEVPAPVGSIFLNICQKHAMGIPLHEGVSHEDQLLGDPDFRLFSASIRINSKSGGALVDVIDGIAGVIRDRQRLGRRFRALVAQTDYSKRILISLPVIIFFGLNLLDPEYMGVLVTEPGGGLILSGAAGMLFCGWLVMNHMSSAVEEAAK